MPTAKFRSAAGALCVAAAALWLTPAYPHAVCGARIFPATLAIDDPGVLDELTLPAVSYVPFNSDGAHEVGRASFSWTKTITPGMSVVIGSGPTWEHPGGYGWNGLDTELQWQALCLPDAEFMFKVGFDIGSAGTGTGMLAGSGGQNTYSPLVVAGLGFGTLPESVKYLRPLAITAEFSTTSPGQDWTAGVPNVSTFNWGFTLQYSLPYFNTQLAEIDNDFLKHLVPIAEFAASRRRSTMARSPRDDDRIFPARRHLRSCAMADRPRGHGPDDGRNRSRRRRDRLDRFLSRRYPQQNSTNRSSPTDLA